METAQLTPLVVQPSQRQALKPVQTLFNVKSNQDLAKELNWKNVKGLTLLGKTKSDHYSTFSIRKKGGSGRYRILYNPSQLMRVAQYKILTRVLNKVEIPDYIYAFEKGKSIPIMAQLHTGKELVISLDLKDYFPSIKQHLLQDMFVSLGFSSSPARTLSELCTYGPAVPQGALTSPKISNIVTMLTFGPEVKDFCEEQGLSLSIYADDITMSSAQPLDGTQVQHIIETVGRSVSKYGFKINQRKTKVMRKSQRQWVCGAVVNERVNLSKQERLKLRAITHNCAVNGIEAEAAKNSQSPEEFTNQIMGRMNWFAQLNNDAGMRMKNRFHELVTGQTATRDITPEGENVCPSERTALVEETTPW